MQDSFNDKCQTSSAIHQDSEYFPLTSSMSLTTPLRIVKNIVKDDVRSVYKIGKVIGSGNFGTVRLAYPYSNLNKVFAIKSIP